MNPLSDIPAPLPEEIVTRAEALAAWAQGMALLESIHAEENAKNHTKPLDG